RASMAGTRKLFGQNGKRLLTLEMLAGLPRRSVIGFWIRRATPRADPSSNQDTEHRIGTFLPQGVPGHGRFGPEQECMEIPESKGRRPRCVRPRSNAGCS